MGYNNHKIQTELSVPFKWEKQPGIAKNMVKPSKDLQDTDNVCEWHLHLEKSLLLNLPPPPGACGSGALEKPKEDDDDDDDGLLLQLPPCVYDHKATGRSTAKRCASRKQDRFVEDPFRVAFEECTKKGYSTKLLDGRDGAAGRTRKNDKKKKKKAGSWRDVLISVDLSCKRTSTNVMKSHMRMPS